MKVTSYMSKKKPKIEEFNQFSNLSEEWWKPEGKFKILHNIFVQKYLNINEFFHII